MKIDLNLYGVSFDRYARLAKSLRGPLTVASKPFFGDNYNEVLVEGANGSLAFSASAVAQEPSTGGHRAEYIDLTADRFSDVNEKGNVQISCFAQVSFAEFSKPIDQPLFGDYASTSVRKDLSFIDTQRNTIVVSGISLCYLDHTIDIKLSDYEESLTVSINGASGFWGGHTLLAVFKSTA